MPTNTLQTFRKVIGADKTRQNMQADRQINTGITTKNQQPTTGSQKIKNIMEIVPIR